MADYSRAYEPPEYLEKAVPRVNISSSGSVWTSTHSSSPLPERSKVLREANDLINGDRQEEYGTPRVNFRRIADLWDVLVPRPDGDWTEGDVALALLGLKLARAVQGYKRDTYVDVAGYAALAVELNETEDDN